MAHLVCSDPFFLKVCREGFSLMWDFPPSPPPTAEAFRGIQPGPQRDAFAAEMARLTAEDVIEFVRPAGERPRLEDKGEHLQPIFCILQGDRWRQIWNMKRTNAQLRPRPFKMTGVSVWRELLSAGDWMVSIDIKDAYCNILLKEGDRKYQRFVFDGKVWQIKTLPFGLSQAPWAWTKFLNPLIKKWRKMGVKVIGWLDDIIFAHQDKNLLLKALQTVLDDLSMIGLKVNTKVGKSTLTPTRQLTWCGIYWDSLRMFIKIPQKRMKLVRKEIKDLLHCNTPTAKRLCRVLGKLQATAEAVLPARVYGRTLLRDLHGTLKGSSNYNVRVKLSETAKNALAWLRANIVRWNGTSLLPHVSVPVTITTDASPWAWGAILKIGDEEPLPTSGFFSAEESAAWQNNREAGGVEHALHTFAHKLRALVEQLPKGHLLQVTIEQDNVSVVSYLRRQGGRKKQLSIQIERIIKWALVRRLRLTARWIPGTEMPADEWSRELALEDRGDWSVHQHIFMGLCERLRFRPKIDLMASRLNKKLPRYFSFRPDPHALDFDALSDDKDWGKEDAYIAPPEHLVGKVLAKIQRDKARVLLLAPWWPEARWWNTLMTLTTDKVRVHMTDETVQVNQGQDPRRWPGACAVAALVDASTTR